MEYKFTFQLRSIVLQWPKGRSFSGDMPTVFLEGIVTDGEGGSCESQITNQQIQQRYEAIVEASREADYDGEADIMLKASAQLFDELRGINRLN